MSTTRPYGSDVKVLNWKFAVSSRLSNFVILHFDKVEEKYSTEKQQQRKNIVENSIGVGKRQQLNCSVVKLIGILFYDVDHETISIQRATYFNVKLCNSSIVFHIISLLSLGSNLINFFCCWFSMPLRLLLYLNVNWILPSSMLLFDFQCSTTTENACGKLCHAD